MTLRLFIHILVRFRTQLQQAARTSIYLHHSLIWWARVYCIKCCESHSLSRTGCRSAWRHWSSFIHDADYCDNLNTERLLIGHKGTCRLLIGRHCHIFMTRDTELPWHDSLCHDQKRISSRNAVNINIALLLLETWMFLPLNISHDAMMMSFSFLFTWNMMIVLFKIGHASL